MGALEIGEEHLDSVSVEVAYLALILARLTPEALEQAVVLAAQDASAGDVVEVDLELYYHTLDKFYSAVQSATGGLH